MPCQGEVAARRQVAATQRSELYHRRDACDSLSRGLPHPSCAAAGRSIQAERTLEVVETQQAMDMYHPYGVVLDRMGLYPM